MRTQDQAPPPLAKSSQQQQPRRRRRRSNSQQRTTTTRNENAVVVEGVKLGGSQTNLPMTTIPKGVTQVWGSLYGVTGARIGPCFFDPSSVEKEVVFAPVTGEVMSGVVQQAAAAPAPAVHQPKTGVKKKKMETETKKMKRRIFIGAVQACWGYTRPKIRLLKAETVAKRSYDSMPRYYIGKRKYLFYPIEAEEAEEEGVSSPLTWIEEEEEGEFVCLFVFEGGFVLDPFFCVYSETKFCTGSG